MLMSRETGQNISDEEHLRQSIIDIITTTKGSRVMRRDYGCGLIDLIDHPVSRAWFSKVRATITEAIDRWEPRLVLHKINVNAKRLNEGKLLFDFEGLYLPTRRVIKLADVEVAWVRVAA